MAKHLSIVSKTWRGVLGDKWLLKLEKKAFGWHYWSLETQDETSWGKKWDGDYGEKHTFVDWIEFRRLSPYTHNFLFILAEALSNVFSWCRRVFINFGVPLFILALIINLLLPEELGSLAVPVMEWLAIGYGVSIAGTVLFAVLGFVLRLVFAMDGKLEEICGEDVHNACYFDNEK